MPTLTPEQQKSYYASQGNVANPLSPLAYLESLNKTSGMDAVAGKEPSIISTMNSGKIESKIGNTINTGKTAMETVAEVKKNAPEPTPPDLMEGETPEERLTRLREESFTKSQNAYDNLAIANTEEASADVAELKRQWDNLRKSQEEINNFNQGAQTQALFRTETARYAPETTANEISATMSKGLEKLSSIDSQYQNAINKTKAAMKAKNYELAYTASKEADKFYTDSLAEISKQKTEAAKLAKEAQDKIDAVKKEETMTNLFSSGVTDPIEILKSLKTSGVSASSKEVKDFLTNVATETGAGNIEKLNGEAKNFFILKGMGNVLPPSIVSLPEEQQLGAYIKWNKDLTTSPKAKAKGEGSDTSADVGFEQFSNEQIALSAIPTQLRNSDAELKRYIQGIRKGLANGMSPYDISDNLIGYKITNPDKFSSSMRSYIAQSNLGNQEISNVARLINSGDKTGAITVLENTALSNQKKLDPDGYTGEATAKYYAEKVNEIEKTIKDGGLWNVIGPVEGGIANITGKVSFFRRKDAAKVQAKVTSLVAEMRNHLSGTAVTESEKAFLEPLIASLGDKEGVFQTKLHEIKDNSLTRHNQARTSANLPELDEASLMSKKKRIPLYQSGMMNDDNQFEDQTSTLLNTPLPTVNASVDFWGKAQ